MVRLARIDRCRGGLERRCVEVCEYDERDKHRLVPARESHRRTVVSPCAEAESGSCTAIQSGRKLTWRRRHETEHARLPGPIRLPLIAEHNHEAGRTLCLGNGGELSGARGVV